MKLPIRSLVFSGIHWANTHRILSVIILAIIGLITYFVWPKPPPPLETYKVKEGNITQALSATGKVESEQTVNLNFLAAGKLAYVGAQKGDEVTKGQVIASLDQRSVQKNLQSAMEDYAKQRNTFEELKDDKGVDRPEDASNDEIKRILENNQHDLDKAVISVELQTLAREQSVLVSPIDGVLIESGANVPGVNIAATTTYTVADPYHLIFKTDVDEADIGKVRLNQPIKITLDAYPERKISVPVTYIDLTSHKTETGANAFTVEALLPDNTNFEYRIGMSGDAEIVVSERKNVLVIPISSVEDDTYVYVRKNGTYEKRKVRLGIQGDIDVEVKDGLKIGEEIATQPDEAAKLVKKK